MRHPFHHQLLHDLAASDDCSDLVELLYDDSSCSSFTSSTAMTNFSSCTNNEGSVPAGSSLKGFCSLEPMIPITMDSFMERCPI